MASFMCVHNPHDPAGQYKCRHSNSEILHANFEKPPNRAGGVMICSTQRLSQVRGVVAKRVYFVPEEGSCSQLVQRTSMDSAMGAALSRMDKVFSRKLKQKKEKKSQLHFIRTDFGKSLIKAVSLRLKSSLAPRGSLTLFPTAASVSVYFRLHLPPSVSLL